MLDLNRVQTVKELVECNMWWKFHPYGCNFEGDSAFQKQPKFLGGKSANEPYTLSIFEFKNPHDTKSIQYIALKFLVTVNRAVFRIYLELIYLYLKHNLNCVYMLMR